MRKYAAKAGAAGREAFGARLAAARARRRWKVINCAAWAGVSPWTWERWETGDQVPRFDQIVRIAEALGCNLVVLAEPLTIAWGELQRVIDTKNL